MAWVTPRTWATGEDITAARLNENRDSVTFLGTPPSCRVYNNAAISHTTSGSTQYLTFNSERFDTDTMHSTAVNTGRVTATTAGKYAVWGMGEFASNATGQRGFSIRLSGTTTIAATLADSSAATVFQGIVSTFYALAATEYVELGAFQSSGGALNVTSSANFSPELAAAWQSL